MCAQDVSKDGRRAVDADLQVFDLVSGALLARVDPGDADVWTARLTYDGLYVIWLDRLSVRVARVADGALVAHACSHERPTGLCTLDARYTLVVGREDGRVLMMTLVPSRYAADGPRSPAEGPRYGAEGPRYAAEGLRYAADGPRYAAEGPRYDAEGPRYGAEGPRYAAEGPRYGTTPPRSAAEGLRYGAEGPRYAAEGPRYAAEGTRYGATPPRSAAERAALLHAAHDCDVSGLDALYRRRCSGQATRDGDLARASDTIRGALALRARAPLLSTATPKATDAAAWAAGAAAEYRRSCSSSSRGSADDLVAVASDVAGAGEDPLSRRSHSVTDLLAVCTLTRSPPPPLRTPPSAAHKHKFFGCLWDFGATIRSRRRKKHRRRTTADTDSLRDRMPSV